MKRAVLSLAVLAVASATSACTSGPGHYLTTDAKMTQPIHAVELSSDAGHVNVHSGGAAITIHRRTNYHSDQPPHPGQQVRGGTLILTAGCSDCGTDYDVTVPASVALTINDKSGEITLDGMAGAIDVASGAGAVKATGLRSPSVRVRISSGPVELGFSTAPTSVTAHSSAGNVTATVPGGPYNIDASTKAGARHINVSDSPSAPGELTLTSNAGDVTVNAA
jgi:hypothetical protein